MLKVLYYDTSNNIIPVLCTYWAIRTSLQKIDGFLLFSLLTFFFSDNGTTSPPVSCSAGSNGESSLSSAFKIVPQRTDLASSSTGKIFVLLIDEPANLKGFFRAKLNFTGENREKTERGAIIQSALLNTQQMLTF